MRRRPASSVSRAATAGAAAALILVLTSCGPTVAPSPSPTGSTDASASPDPSTPAAPVYVADGTAQDNLPLFAATTAQVWAGDQRGSGRAYIDALVAAGFDRGAMQVTQDQSTVGHAAESVQFSVRWGEAECLVGQVGPSTGEPVTAVMPQLAEGRCLIGNTRPIDW